MKKHNVHNHIGWVMFGIIVVIFIWLLSKKKSSASVTVKATPLWDSTKDSAPSTIQAPPFQDAAGNLVCADGYSLWKDSATGLYACFKDPISFQTDVKNIPIENNMFVPPGFTLGKDFVPEHNILNA